MKFQEMIILIVIWAERQNSIVAPFKFSDYSLVLKVCENW